ncbi:hypothetical protein BT96DRAFT_33046 [Gymnopus androsaceus JB14]|uniref:Uncharacterized protein n=1 Tax=Gymnopus androsaceus JB14 TaxID=1447944 RepID=A0A6A4HKF4_9AGAR|nr:hypothetical protein BT96DRAFT_33046 [Gymnopus androsaceus JB14]
MPADLEEYMDTDPSEEKDYSSWFESADVPPHTVAFQPASFATASTSLFSTASALVDKEKSVALGFRTAGKGTSLLAPSAEALARAEEKIRQIWQEEEPARPEDSSVRSPLRSVQKQRTRNTMPSLWIRICITTIEWFLSVPLAHRTSPWRSFRP